MSTRRPSHSSDFFNTSQDELVRHPAAHQFTHAVADTQNHAVISSSRSGMVGDFIPDASHLLASDEEFNEAEDLSQYDNSSEGLADHHSRSHNAHDVSDDNVSFNELSALRSVASRNTYSTFGGGLGASHFLSKQRSRNFSRSVHPELIQQELGLLKDNGFEVNHLSRTVSKQSSFIPRTPSIYAAVAPANQDVESVVNLWEEAVENGDITNSKFSTELKVLFSSSLPLVITFLLQSLLGINALFFVGKLGTTELSAYTLGSMTGNITGLVIVQGLSTCLDTLCSQAFGAGKYHLVGIYFQRCTFLILSVFVPISFFWIFASEALIRQLIPEPELAHLSAKYLISMIPGIPGFIMFETGKRFLQSQGIYIASTYTLFTVIPINFALNYLLIEHESFNLGFIGAPISLSITFWLMPLGLLLYIFFYNGKDGFEPLRCWPGIKWNLLFKNWGLIFQLAIPGTIMCLAELLAFEILTFSSAHISPEALAAQSIIASVGSISFQIPFGISIATSTRVANFIGAGLPHLAKKTTKVSFLFGVVVACLINVNILYFGRFLIPTFFTDDEKVIDLTAESIPLIAFISIFDEITAISSGILRGMGLQKIGSYLNLGFYYLYGVPLSLILAFNFHLDIAGLWLGTGSALTIIGFIQTFIVNRVNYDRLIEEAKIRNSEDV